ncbi:hypothetical protein SDC9_208528 [bioreactor metagenome]|uniref:Uncharacterized protein n=1 Tax=bioreactor metagenome TaxID=1076179 RepID=A0A645JBH6_9ZZZZ
MPVLRIVGTFHPVTIFYILIIEAKDNDGIYISHPEFIGKRYLGIGILLVFIEQDQGTGGGRTRENGKVHAVGHQGRSEREHTPPPVFDTLVFVCGVEIDPVIECSHVYMNCFSASSMLQ